MSELLRPFLLGMLLSALYFGELWLNVRSLLHAPRPHQRLLRGLLLRTSLILGLFYLLLYHWSSNIDLLSLCLGICGFLSLRNLLISWVRYVPSHPR